MKRVSILVLDSFGIGASADAERFGDVDSDTLGHIASACASGEANNGRQGNGKDTPGGHWEMAGVPVLVYGKNINAGSLDKRDSFADMGQTIAEYFGLSTLESGQSFLNQIV